MYLTMRYFDGRRVEAIVLAIGADRMRITIPDSHDAIELRQSQGIWMTDSNELVELEALLAEEETAPLLAGFYPVARNASAGAVV